MTRSKLSVALVLLVIVSGVARAGEPAASGPAAPAVSSTVVSLDHLQGQEVDIAPWAGDNQTRPRNAVPCGRFYRHRPRRRATVR